MKVLVNVTRNWRNLLEVALGLRRFTITDGCETRRTKHKSKCKKYEKYATINTGCDVKIQHSQSEMGDIRIYHIRQKGISLSILLN